MIRLILLLSLPLLVDAGCAVDFKHSTQEPAEDEATTTQSDVCKPGFRRFHRVDLRVVVCMKITTSDTVVSKEQAAALCTAEGYKLMGLNNVNEGVDLRVDMLTLMGTNSTVFIDGTRVYTECLMIDSFVDRNKIEFSDGLTNSTEILMLAGTDFDCLDKDITDKCLSLTNAESGYLMPAPCTGVANNVKGAVCGYKLREGRD